MAARVVFPEVMLGFGLNGGFFVWMVGILT